MAYLVFMIIGICGYFTIPSVANYIIQAGGQNSFLHKVTSGFNATSRSVTNNTIAAGGAIVNSVSNSFSSGNGNGGSDYMKNRLSGK
jgi:hypothetical protein